MTGQAGNWATPYGVEITATAMDLNGKPEPMMNAENMAIMLGIHDPEKRRGFADDLRALMKTGGSMDPLVAKFGGGKPARIPIQSPARAIYPTIPNDRGTGDATDGASLRDAVDSWVAIVADAPRWHERADTILDCIAKQAAEFGTMRRDLAGMAMSNIVTAVLENLGEKEVNCLQQAAVYALSAHDPWRAAGRDWLLPHRRTWVRDWIAARPVYRRLAHLTGMVHRDVPSWLKEITQ